MIFIYLFSSATLEPVEHVFKANRCLLTVNCYFNFRRSRSRAVSAVKVLIWLRLP
jgi:hypothetical protein